MLFLALTGALRPLITNDCWIRVYCEIGVLLMKVRCESFGSGPGSFGILTNLRFGLTPSIEWLYANVSLEVSPRAAIGWRRPVDVSETPWLVFSSDISSFGTAAGDGNSLPSSFVCGFWLNSCVAGSSFGLELAPLKVDPIFELPFKNNESALPEFSKLSSFSFSEILLLRLLE